MRRTDMPALEAVAFDRTERDVVGQSRRRRRIPRPRGRRYEVRSRLAAGSRPDPGRNAGFRAHRPEPESEPGSGLNLSGSAIDQATPVALEAPPERQRVMMLPLALVAGLCLILGYAVGTSSVDARSTSPRCRHLPRLRPRPERRGHRPRVSLLRRAHRIFRRSLRLSLRSRRATSPAPSPVAKSTAPPTVARPTGSNAPKTGRLVVNSSPAKAGVTVNGKWSGRTPLTLERLAVRQICRPRGRAGLRGRASRSSRCRLAPPRERRRHAQADSLKPSGRLRRPATAPQAQAAEPSKPTATTAGSIYVDSRPQGAACSSTASNSA